MAENNEVLLSARGVCKAFGPTRALIDVDIDVRRGEIRGLIGENGSGKSTLSAIVAGALGCDEGTFTLKGESYMPKNMVDAQNKGVSMVIQEMGTIPGITVASNIFSGRLEQFNNRIGLLNWKRINRKADDILADIGAPDIKGAMMIDQLNFEDRKIVEIARAMVSNPDLLIIDETTTALAQKGRTIIYNLIERIHRENKAVLFISHDLDELMRVCNTITVLRDGLIIGTLTKENMSVDQMRSMMVGRELSGSYYRADYDGSYSDEVVLTAHQVTLSPYFENIDLELHKGEILGFGGLSNCGMHELGRVLFGIEKPITGYVKLNRTGVEVSNTTTAVQSRMAYVSKDRDKEAIILDASIQSNVVLPSLKNLTKAHIHISPRSEKRLADDQIKTMSIKCRDEKQSCKELSGGNKQKVVFAKWLGKESDIMILDCPTRGIDVGVKADMYRLMMDLKKEGKAIIMISEELPELIGMSDRMLIFKDGELKKVLKRAPGLEEKDVIEYII
ncbi:MAG: sugar ABC transporter ATP-binding protein [Treponema sp.]|jgi:ribose transport system ATP-binding protein|nr:sugar ABC transporter ATP-binding protein [Treponema sp.]